MKNNPIGIFDSGIGGLTVANAIKEVLPYENIIYFGDTEHLPYGEKSKDSIQNFSRKIIQFLIKKNCKVIVIACNSASSVSDNRVLNYSENKKVFNVIDPVIEEVVRVCSNYNIGVIGTKATIGSGIYTSKIQELCNSANISSLSTPLLAPMIEEGFVNEEISKKVISNYLSEPILRNIDHLILACTHYPLIQNEINEYYKGKVNVIDSAKIVAHHIAESLESENLLKETKETEHHFYVSDYTESFEKSARFFFKEEVKLEEVNLHL